MANTKIIKIEESKESFKEKVSDLLEDMWDKIGRYHHGVSGHVARKFDGPDTDLSDAENVLSFKLELPGVDEDDVEVAINSGRLIVSGEKSDERQQTGNNYIFRECSYGRFERSFPLPEKVKPGESQAAIDKGVLTVTVPYVASNDGEARKIDVTHT